MRPPSTAWRREVGSVLFRLTGLLGLPIAFVTLRAAVPRAGTSGGRRAQNMTANAANRSWRAH